MSQSNFEFGLGQGKIPDMVRERQGITFLR